jgi:catechol 2,3-dioxygenase-like lactoylglutathione lyase family enzyme
VAEQPSVPYRRSMDAPRGRIVAKVVFPVADLGVAASFYERLGFAVERYDDAYAWVRHAGDELLHLAVVPDLDRAANHAAGYLHVASVDSWHAGWSAAGASPGPVVDTPWGMREFRICDPDGNLLRVGQNR